MNWHLLYNTATGQSASIGTVIADPLPEGITALPLSDAEGEGMQNGSLIWDAASRSLIPTPPPVVTAEQAVSAYFTPYQTIALQRLELALMTAGKPLGPKMTAAKEWLETIMLSWAMDPTPKSDWSAPQATFAEASAEAVGDLQP
jgi:hypothetical protein